MGGLVRAMRYFTRNEPFGIFRHVILKSIYFQLSDLYFIHEDRMDQLLNPKHHSTLCEYDQFFTVLVIEVPKTGSPPQPLLLPFFKQHQQGRLQVHNERAEPTRD